MRAVIDTGVLVSAMIKPAGAIGEVLHALRDGQLTTIYSTDILEEIIEVLGRPAFRTKYHIMPEDITALVNLVRLRGELVTPQKKISACRDPLRPHWQEKRIALFPATLICLC
jgi:putative PIN family toxin of toxin-antitoxin system